ncbi:alpha/beta hydrolase [Gelidibacter maritimus]|uniref:Alpha/beta hydrolase n=1 Tax=Gelidibacter maritimus TaxID=2761487 RepID=A0A7W2M7D8_9FLAO|nr:alpha/beta hydrolase [Gelidibacter maritimus]MBA6153992.1 alpha/beta hydrolase [Gelidibacter maritimus]
MINSNQAYVPDILGDEFEQRTLTLKDDYEGKVIATLIRRQTTIPSAKAILYIHGFSDYFFQDQMAKRFNKEGYTFYALDLRKYGRSYLNHQIINNVRSLIEYDEEINATLHIIKSEKHSEVILMGHSTGGLIITYYAGRHLHSNLFHGIICNSPFYEFNLNAIERKIGIPVLSFLSNYFPNLLISGGFSRFYGYSLHRDHFGEWDYNLAWKPHDLPKVTLSFIHAIHKAHKSIQNNMKLNVPGLILYSSQTIKDKKWSERFMEGDAVLNVDHIRQYASQLQGKVTVREIEHGLHDLVLSKHEVREYVYKIIFEWLKMNFKNKK